MAVMNTDLIAADDLKAQIHDDLASVAPKFCVSAEMESMKDGYSVWARLHPMGPSCMLFSDGETMWTICEGELLADDWDGWFKMLEDEGGWENMEPDVGNDQGAEG